MKRLPEILERERGSLRKISDFIHEHPELGFEEFQACALLKKYLTEQGFVIRDNPGGVETAVIGYYASPNADDSVPLFGFIGEYDALTGLGHGCGHNLIAVSALAAVLAARELLTESGVPFRICYLGTPAEEILGGKIRMAAGGAFDGISAAVEAHPWYRTLPDPGWLSVARCRIAFHGKASHAAMAPEEGRNALDAVCEFVCRIRDWQKDLGKRERVHGIITRGGEAPNIIPDYTEAFYYVRASNERAIAGLKKRLAELAELSAGNAGCTCEIKWISAYKGMVFNTSLNAAFRSVWKELTGEEIPMTDGTQGCGSSDTGDISHLMPCAQYHFGVTGGEFKPLHSPEFRDAAFTDEAFEQSLMVGTAMAEVAVRYFREPDFRRAVHEDWKKQLAES